MGEKVVRSKFGSVLWLTSSAVEPLQITSAVKRLIRAEKFTIKSLKYAQWEIGFYLSSEALIIAFLIPQIRKMAGLKQKKTM